MARKVAENKAVAFFNSDHPEVEREGFYVVEADDADDHTNAKVGRRVEWAKDSPDPENGTPNHENNAGHWTYVDEE